MGRKSKISRLPAEIKTYIESKLAAGQLTLRELLADVGAKFPEAAASGDLPGRDAIHRYGAKLEQRLSAIRASTEAAKIIHAQIGDREDTRSGVLIAMIQSELFDSMMALQTAADSDMDPAERIGLLSMAAKNIATLTRSSVHLKKYQTDIEESARRALLAEQEANLKDAVRSQGMDEAQADFWRRKILGI